MPAKTASPMGGGEWSRLLRRLQAILRTAIEEGFGVLVALALIKFFDWLIGTWFGADVRFFGVVPVKYVVDAAHFITFARLLWRLLKRINKNDY